ncbi:hypothetical protein [Streptomyces sp. NPDC057315]|uniref:hypothetical protein n=1 Tax=unclassified Streptomyces TaxID=2593676 RepID=UPI003632E26A
MIFWLPGHGWPLARQPKNHPQRFTRPKGTANDLEDRRRERIDTTPESAEVPVRPATGEAYFGLPALRPVAVARNVEG